MKKLWKHRLLSAAGLAAAVAASSVHAQPAASGAPGATTSAAAAEPSGGSAQPKKKKPLKAHPGAKRKVDTTGRKRVGKASFYAKKFAGRKMADGKRMNPHGNNAASKTLPLGTKAKVTNLETGKSAVVTIQDRGPFVEGRIVDLSPATARKIGISEKDGVAPVEVAPIEVPLPDGSVKPGEGARGP